MGWTVYDSSGNLLSSIALVDNVVATAKIADDAVTYAKMQNLATADRVLGSASTGVIGEVQVVADMIATDAVTNVKVATGIDAVKIADGSVTSTEFQYINTLSSNAQTQLAAKQATIDSSARLNANLIHDGSVTNTEFGYISTLSSNAQTQLAAKQATIDSSARLDAASIGANGNVSNTEYGYLSGVTSDIQTQISAAAGATLSGSTNNTVVTVTGADAMIGEANLTFDGSLLSLNSNYTIGDTNGFRYPSQSGNGMRINSGSDISFAIDSGNTQTDRSFRFYVNGLNGAGTQVLQLNEAGRFTLGLSTSKLGIGTDNPDKMMHLYQGSAGGMAPRATAMLVIEDDTSDEISLQFLMPAGGTRQQTIFFGDNDENTRGGIIYDHGDDNMRFNTNGSTRLTINASGNFTGSSSNDISDERIKENIENTTVGLAEVMQLRPVKFNFKDGKGWGTPGQKFYGLIAQEVGAVIPEAMHIDESFDDEFDPNQLPDLKSVSMTQITTALIKAIQELKAEVDALKG